MAITAGNYGTGTNVSTNFVLNVPAGVSNGDLLIAALCNYYTGDVISTPAGWTDISPAQPSNMVGKVFSRTASSEPSTYSFPVNNGDANTTSGVIQAFSGGSVLVDVIGSFGTTDSGVALSLPAITVGHGGVLVAVGFGKAVSGTGSLGTPTGFTSLLDVVNTGGGTTMGVKICDKTNASTGSTGTVSQTAATYASGLLLQIYESAPVGIAFDAAANSGYQAAQSTYTFNRTVTGSNTFLAVDVALLSAGQTVTSVVDDSGGGNVAMTFIGAKSTVTSFGRVEQWGLVSPTTGTKAIQVNLSGSIASASTAVSYTGVHQTSPTEGFNSAQATNVGAADATVSITTVADNCWVHGAIATDDTAITANQTSRNNVTGVGGSGANEDNNAAQTPAGAVTMSYTGVGALATWAIAGYAIRPIAASGLGTIFYQSLLNGLSSAGKFFQNRLG